jgi:predicted nucleic acid-binding protein
LALYYLDTSALVKLYVREPGTDFLLHLASRAANHHLAVLSLARVEFRSAIRKRERVGDLDKLMADELIVRLEKHLETRFILQALNEAILAMASELIDRYPLRAYDAVQLAGCLALRTTSGKQAPTFVCSDSRLQEAAQSEGLPGIDPSGQR